MDYSRRKIIAIIVTVLVVVFGPFIALGNGMMRYYQKKIDAAPEGDTPREWQLRLAKICDWTWRPLLANEMYRKFIDHYPKDPRRPDVMWRRANNFKEAGRDYNEQARDAFRELCTTYPDTTEGKTADRLLCDYYKDYER
jgi:hypothetical protein